LLKLRLVVAHVTHVLLLIPFAAFLIETQSR
jgi:hypothetical protein